VSDNIAARHILSLSGGKDSTALAVYLHSRMPELEYVFCDTGEELPETYGYLDRLEVFLGKQIVRLNPDRPFDHYLQVYRGVLPDARTRWCTRKLKIEPFERYVGNDACYNYIGIRADELHRKGYISTKPNIVAVYPFIDEGVKQEDVYRILEESGLGLPAYYQWRSRSGCYFCFFQRRVEWVGLLENHPDLYEKAAEMEKIDAQTDERFTWSTRESLQELQDPERIQQIKAEHERWALQQAKRHKANMVLNEVFSLSDETEDANSCLICHL
jgi:3'-phosphoadenosine 5'-phosphosulfate sulfotransferase (PAPS reductase)/FAD synthetase